MEGFFKFLILDLQSNLIDIIKAVSTMKTVSFLIQLIQGTYEHCRFIMLSS